jgi:transposase
VASKFTPENRDGLLELLADGLSLKDACREVGLREKTVKGWLTRGRQEEGTDYAEFAAAVDSAREEAEQKEQPLDEEELMLVASRAAKKGSVAAMKLVYEMLRAKKGDSGGESEGKEFDDLEPDDELAPRREAKAR